MMLSLPYPKIETLYHRGNDFKVDVDSLREPAFGAVSPWVLTEKVDGTNIRLHWQRHRDAEVGQDVVSEIGGRSDNAQIQKNLMGPLEATVAEVTPGVEIILDRYDLESLTIYGEGYGAGVQKGGGRYRPEPGFIAFDYLVNSKSWLAPHDARANSSFLGLEHVPEVGTWRDLDYIWRRVAEDSIESAWSGVESEGIVAQPIVPLYDARGKRIMWKLKRKDFR